MKKLFSLLLAAAMLLMLVACGAKSADNGTPNTTENPAAAETNTSAPTEEAPTEMPDTAPTETTDTTPVEEPTSEGGKALIAYFSWSGNTAKLAQMIADETGGELFAVEPETPYPDDYDAVVDQAKVEQNENARPAVANRVENWEDYDTVFVGYPNWWSDVPMVMLTFLESYDWSGKTVIPFCTSGGGGFGNGISSITTATSGATVLDGFHVSGSRVDNAQSDVTEWITRLDLQK